MEREWNLLMEQSYQLKKHAQLSLWEQCNMTAEERAWWINRINEDIRKQNESSGGTVPGMSGPLGMSEG